MMIRQASTADMAEIMTLVEQVFSDEQNIPRELIPLPAEREPRWWYIRQNERIAATVALYRDGEEWHMGRLAVAPGLRGGHIATQLLEVAIPAAFATGIDVIRTDCRDTTVHILQKFGGEIAGKTEVFFKGNITPVILKRDNLPLEYQSAAQTHA